MKLSLQINLNKAKPTKWSKLIAKRNSGNQSMQRRNHDVIMIYFLFRINFMYEQTKPSQYQIMTKSWIIFSSEFILCSYLKLIKFWRENKSCSCMLWLLEFLFAISLLRVLGLALFELIWRESSMRLIFCWVFAWHRPILSRFTSQFAGHKLSLHWGRLLFKCRARPCWFRSERVRALRSSGEGLHSWAPKGVWRSWACRTWTSTAIQKCVAHDLFDQVTRWYWQRSCTMC